MEIKKSLPVAAALLALGVGGPAVALADDGDHGTAGAPATAPLNVTGDVELSDNNSTADEQGDVENTDLAAQVQNDGAENEIDDQGDDDAQSGDQDDSQNDDLAVQVDQEDGADTGGDSQENQVEDSNDD